MSYKPGNVEKNDENGLYSQNVFNVSTIMKDTQTQMRYPLKSDMENGVRSDDITYWWCAPANVQQTEFSLHRPPPSIHSRVKDPAGDTGAPRQPLHGHLIY